MDITIYSCEHPFLHTHPYILHLRNIRPLPHNRKERRAAIRNHNRNRFRYKPFSSKRSYTLSFDIKDKLVQEGIEPHPGPPKPVVFDDPGCQAQAEAERAAQKIRRAARAKEIRAEKQLIKKEKQLLEKNSLEGAPSKKRQRLVEGHQVNMLSKLAKISKTRESSDDGLIGFDEHGGISGGLSESITPLEEERRSKKTAWMAARRQANRESGNFESPMRNAAQRSDKRQANRESGNLESPMRNAVQRAARRQEIRSMNPPPTRGSNTQPRPISRNLISQLAPSTTPGLQPQAPIKFGYPPSTKPLHKQVISQAEKDALTAKLQQAGQGILPDTPLVQDPSMKKSVENFIYEINCRMTMATCVYCNERRSSVYNYKFRGKMDEFKCINCAKQESAFKLEFPSVNLAAGFVPKLGAKNDMDPWFHPNPTAVAEFHHLRRDHPLREMEKSLIAMHLPLMTVIRLKSQQSAFKGNVINFVQDIGEICTELPRLPANLPTFRIRRKRGESPADYKDFMVNRDNVSKWLHFLKKWNPAYAQITINEAALNELPNDGSVYQDLQELEEEKEESNENSATLATETAEPMIVDVQDCPYLDSDPEDADSGSEDEGGFAAGPNERDNEDRDFVLYTGIGRAPETERSAINSMRANVLPSGTLPWPRRGEEPLDEYNTPYLLTRSFPTLFPFGNGDVSNKVRELDVTFHDAVQHYVWYAHLDEQSGKWEWPMSQDVRFIHYIQDIDERKRIQGQASMFIQKNPEYANLTIHELRDKINSLGGAEYALKHKIQSYGANILGSNAYMAERKKELTSLINQEGVPTIWWTLSLANCYWDDLNKLFGEVPVIREGESEEDFEKRWKKHAMANYTKHAHVVNDHFVQRIKFFVDTFFGSGGLEASWYWYRFEWQKRGNIHAHGLAKLKNDPGLVKLALQVQDGRMAQRLLVHNKELKHTHDHECSYEDYEFVPTPKDVWLESTDVFYSKYLTEHSNEQGGVGLESQEEEALLDKVKLAVAAEVALVTFRDYLLSSNNPSVPLPADAAADARESTHDKLPFPHPCTQVHSNTSMGYSIGGDKPEDIYASLLHFCQRHRHTSGYCLKEGGLCRFKFPRPLLEQSRVVLSQHGFKTGPKKGTLRSTVIELQFQSNDRWMNSHSPLGMLAWGANMDMSILLDQASVVAYVAKYCTKSETPTSALQAMIRSNIVTRTARGQDVETKKVLRSVFNKLATRDKCVMETFHLLNSTPIAKCSHKFTNITITSISRQINNTAPQLSENVEEDVPENGEEELHQERNPYHVEGEVDEEEAKEQNIKNAPAYLKNLIDLYAERMLVENWDTHDLFDSWNTTLATMCLSEFVQNFYKNRKNKIVRRKNDDPKYKYVYTFYPQINSDPANKSTFYKYCYFALIRWKPWQKFYENVIDGAEEDSYPLKDLDTLPPEKRDIIVNMWRALLASNITKSEGADFFIREIDRMRSREFMDELAQDDDHEFQSPGINNRMFSPDANQPELWEELIQALQNHRNDDEDDNVAMEWEQDADHTILQHDYSEAERTVEHIDRRWSEILGEHTIRADRRRITLSDLSPSQQKPVEIWLRMMGLWKSSPDGDFLPPEARPECLAPNVLLIGGAAGTGKSYIIDCLVTEALDRMQLKKPALDKAKPYFILVMAPTGRAAMNVQGYTLHSRDGGLAVPTKDIDDLAKNQLQGAKLLALQERMKHCIGVIIDEYSMVHQNALFWIHDRLRQAYSASPEEGASANASPAEDSSVFGGIPLVLCGDTGQIPPVGGSSLWVDKVTASNGKNKQPPRKLPVVGLAKKGYALWKSIKNVVILQQPQRQRGPFSELLGRLRDAKCTKEDWEYLNQTCSDQYMSAEKSNSFNSPETTWLFNTNSDANKHNAEMLKKLNEPRVRMNAEHSNTKSGPHKHSDDAKRLAAALFLCHGAKMMLLWNLHVDYGLVNGTFGIVRDWIYAEGQKAPDLPQVLILEIDDYKGPPFFTDPQKAKWVPFRPQKAIFESNKKEHRTQFPFTLAYGLTVWKCQGMTLTTKTVYDLGQSEPEAGTTYVACSRTTDIANFSIRGGCTFERLTTAISRNPKFQKRILEDGLQLALSAQTLQYFFSGYVADEQPMVYAAAKEPIIADTGWSGDSNNMKPPPPVQPLATRSLSKPSPPAAPTTSNGADDDDVVYAGESVPTEPIQPVAYGWLENTADPRNKLTEPTARQLLPNYWDNLTPRKKNQTISGNDGYLNMRLYHLGRSINMHQKHNVSSDGNCMFYAYLYSSGLAQELGISLEMLKQKQMSRFVIEVVKRLREQAVEEINKYSNPLSWANFILNPVFYINRCSADKQWVGRIETKALAVAMKKTIIQLTYAKYPARSPQEICVFSPEASKLALTQNENTYVGDVCSRNEEYHYLNGRNEDSSNFWTPPEIHLETIGTIYRSFHALIISSFWQNLTEEQKKNDVVVIVYNGDNHYHATSLR